jgi:hypothetical protein
VLFNKLNYNKSREECRNLEEEGGRGNLGASKHLIIGNVKHYLSSHYTSSSNVGHSLRIMGTSQVGWKLNFHTQRTNVGGLVCWDGS